MKTLLLTVFIAAAVAFGQQGGNTKKQTSQAHVLTNAEFDALLATPDQILIIDVRRPDEVTSNGGFPVYLSIQSSQLAKSLAWIPKIVRSSRCPTTLRGAVGRRTYSLRRDLRSPEPSVRRPTSRVEGS